MEEIPHLPHASTSRTHAMTFVRDPKNSGIINLEGHRLALAIAKKTLDENCFRTAHKTMDRQPPSFKIGDRVYFKKKQPGKWDLKWIPGYRIVQIEHAWTFSAHQKPSHRKSMILAMWRT